MRYCGIIAYDGTPFSGFQKQPNAISVQARLEDALSTILNEKIDIVGCGRTDAGVHATEFYFHFNTTYPNPDEHIHNINALLGDPIALLDLFAVEDDFHARFDAVSRRYEYHIHTMKSPFLGNRSLYLRGYNHNPQSINTNLLHESAAVLLKYKDFNTFCKTRTDVKTTLCEITDSHWDIDGDRWVYHIEANRFLRGMVRLIVGAMLNISKEKLSFQDLENALASNNRLPLDWSVPAHGLYLVRVKYDSF